jgi:Bacterial pre-peptidase C-terminal domain
MRPALLYYKTRGELWGSLLSCGDLRAPLSIRLSPSPKLGGLPGVPPGPRRMPSCPTLLAAVLAVQTALAAAPVITELKPRGAEIGRPFTLTLVGQNLGEGARIRSTLAASFTLVTPSQSLAQSGGMPAGPERSVSFLVEPKADAKPGVYPVRVQTQQGISNILLFTLGTFPEVTEEESLPYAPPHRNDSIETAEPVPAAPVVVNGTLRGPERDIFRVSGKAGERRVFEVEARRSGSAIDPVLRILDGSGKQLARSDDSPGAGLDARLEFTFPRDGNYYVEVTDARFSTQAQNFYRLKMGSYRYAEGIFPLGGRRGEAVPVTFFGGSAGAGEKATADLRKIGQSEAFTRVALPDSPTLPFLFAVSDLPEVMAPVQGAAPVPGVINGRLDKPGEVDRYRLNVEPGEKLLFELQARELGTSKLEGVITVYDGSGKKLDSAGDKPLPEDVFAVQGTSRTSSDPFLNLTVPADAHEISVTVEDLAQRGGPLYGYRLITRRQAEDFRLSISSPFVNVPAGGTALVSVTADRLGYNGPIQLSIANLPEGIRAEGGLIPREYLDENNTRNLNRRGVLLLTAERDVQLKIDQLEIWGEGALADGSKVRRRASGPGMVVDVAGATEQGVVDRQRPLTAPWLGLDLPIALGEAPTGTLAVHQTGMRQMEEGARYEYAYEWTLRGRATPPERVAVDVVGAKDIRVIDMKAAAGGTSGTFAVTTTKATDPARYDLYISGRLKTEDGEEAIVSRPIAFEVSGGTTSGGSN